MLFSFLLIWCSDRHSCITFLRTFINFLSSASSQGSQDGDIDEEMGLTGAVADDMEAEYIRSICETEIINADNLLSLVK